MPSFDDSVDPAKALHPENTQHNARSLNYVRSTLASIAGATAGVLGLTSYSGFMFYFLSSLFAAIVVNLCNTGLSPSKYFRQGFWETASQGLIGNLMSYTLFWTLLYGLVHVYEA